MKLSELEQVQHLHGELRRLKRARAALQETSDELRIQIGDALEDAPFITLSGQDYPEYNDVIRLLRRSIEKNIADILHTLTGMNVSDE